MLVVKVWVKEWISISRFLLDYILVIGCSCFYGNLWSTLSLFFQYLWKEDNSNLIYISLIQIAGPKNIQHNATIYCISEKPFVLLLWFYCYLALLSTKQNKTQSFFRLTYLICVCFCLLNVVAGEFMDQLDFLFQNGKPPDCSPSQAARNQQELKM